MKKFLICFIICIIVALPCDGATQIKTTNDSNDNLNYLYNEIRKLENELNLKTQKLNKCARKNKNFQISGIAAVGLAGAGVATNISLYSKMKNQKKSAENMVNKIKTSNTQIETFFSDLEKMKANLDNDKFSQELSSSLTDAERQRLIELYNNRFDFPDDKDISESDKILLNKIISAMRKCQK